MIIKRDVMCAVSLDSKVKFGQFFYTDHKQRKHSSALEQKAQKHELTIVLSKAV